MKVVTPLDCSLQAIFSASGNARARLAVAGAKTDHPEAPELLCHKRGLTNDLDVSSGMEYPPDSKG